MQCVTVRIELKDVSPLIWRTFTMPTEATLHDLHKVIQVVMGWKNSHLYRFKLGDEICQLPDEEGPARATNSLKEVLGEWLLDGMTRLDYLYDFGDNWEHELAFGELRQNAALACLEGARACPPEDSGGVPGYEDLCAALADAHHSEHKELRRWAGKWQAEDFSLEKVNARLQKLKMGRL